MPKILLRLDWDLPETSPGPVQDLIGTRSRLHRNLPKTCPGPTGDPLGI